MVLSPREEADCGRLGLIAFKGAFMVESPREEEEAFLKRQLSGFESDSFVLLPAEEVLGRLGLAALVDEGRGGLFNSSSLLLSDFFALRLPPNMPVTHMQAD